MTDVVIVGAGMFGMMSARMAQDKGANVTIIDNKARYCATPASGFLLKPSWLTALSEEQIKKGYEVLRALYGVETLNFRVLPTKKTVKIDRALFTYKLPKKAQFVAADVVEVSNGMVKTPKQVFKGKVLIAAGINSDKLVEMPPIKALMGVSLVFRNKQLKEPAMHVWAPYKQAVAFNLDEDQVWFGDGTAIDSKNWKESERIIDAVTRAKKIFKLSGDYRFHVGARPSVEGHKEGYFSKAGRSTWVSTGGAKNGTILAAYQAWRFVKETL
jgi:Dehydrogenases (flavoproteins)